MTITLKKIGIVSLIVASLVAVSLLPLMAGAQDVKFIENVKDIPGIVKIIDRIIDYIFAFLILLATVMVLYAAYLYLTAGGDEGNIGKAKNAIIYAAVGVAVALLAKAVAFIVASIVR